ncbi:MAG: TetR/AcrR family transcriptional regulator [Deltaproteobacteria bacterium]|nr:TetR/AcrR family transcriptional regulator [Deltaproteobacteria bacterium]
MDIPPALTRNTFSNLPSEKQEKIVAAAVREFARQGYRKASMNTIVREAGIAKGSLYQYFRNKEVLFCFIFERFTLLVKKSVAEQGRALEAGTDAGSDFFVQVRNVLLAGIAFIDLYPEYFQIYLKVLFEQDVPRREELLSQVRLFSREYFGPLGQLGQKSGAIRRDVPLDVVIFVLDATLDRFLQSYAQSYPDCGMGLAKTGRNELLDRVNMILRVLREGLTGSGLHAINHDV